MARAERQIHKETPLFRHVSARLIEESDLLIVQNAARQVGFNLKVVAKEGQEYAPIKQGSIRTLKDNSETNGALKIVPQGKAYVSLTRLSRRAEDKSIMEFDKKVKELKKDFQPMIIPLNLGL